MSNTFRQSSHWPHNIFIQMSGAPGSGKSTLAKLLGSLIDAVVIDHDILKSSLLEDNTISFNQAARLAYRLDWTMADAMMEQERSVIIDSPCNYQEIIDKGRALAQKYGYAYWYIECRVDDIDLLDERLRKRAPLRSQRTGVDGPPRDASGTPSIEDSRALFQRWIENPCRPDDNIIVVDSTDSLERHGEYILERILPQSGASFVEGRSASLPKHLQDFKFHAGM
jgi:predicted kinase